MEIGSNEFFSKHNYSLPDGVRAPVVVAWKLRTPENYGNILRLADNIGCLKVLFVIDEILISERKIRKTAGESYHKVVMEFIHEDEIRNSIPENYTWVGVETSENSTNIFETDLPGAMAMFVGNEQHGLPAELLAEFKQVVHIPVPGRCTSLNVSHACAVALFSWLGQVLPK